MYQFQVVVLGNLQYNEISCNNIYNRQKKLLNKKKLPIYYYLYDCGWYKSKIHHNLFLN